MKLVVILAAVAVMTGAMASEPAADRAGERDVVRGLVTDAFCDEVDHSRAIIVVRTGEGDSYAVMPCTDEDSLNQLIGNEAELTGRFEKTGHGIRPRLGRHLVVGGQENVRITRESSADPFDAPSISMLKNQDAETIAGSGRCTVRGFVCAVWNRYSFVVRDAEGRATCVWGSRQEQFPEVGDYVVASGFPETDLYNVDLFGGVWKLIPPVGSYPEEKVETLEPEVFFTDPEDREIVRPSVNGHVFRVRGTLLTVPAANMATGRLELEDGRVITLKSGGEGNRFRGIEKGSMVEVTVYCFVRAEHWGSHRPFPRLRGYQFIVRRDSDLRVLRAPPWWTPARFLVLIGTLLAGLVGVLIWNRTLRRMAERRGRELYRERLAHEASELRIGERTRLAVELHDSLSQNLSGIACQVAAAGEMLGEDRSASAACLSTAERMLQSTRTELRRCLFDLRGDALEERDFSAAIRKTVAPVLDGAGFELDFPVSRAKLGDSVAYAAMCIVRELVANAVFHGKAKKVAVSGRLADGKLEMRVADDGCGFDPARVPGVAQGHFGLEGVKNRAERFRGTLRIESRPGGGTEAEVELWIN